jgi:hypothetical protein
MINLGFEEVMGKHRHSRMNENGELFIRWCAENEMVIKRCNFLNITRLKDTKPD